MLNRINKNIHMLKALHSCNSKQRKNLIKSANPELIHAICDCIVNVAYGRVPINSQQKGVLKKKVKIIKELSNSRKSAARKKKLLVQHGGGFLTSILGPLIKTVAGAIAEI